MAQIAPRKSARISDFGRQHHVADLEALGTWITTDDKGRMLRAQKDWATGAGDRGHHHVSGQSIANAALMTDNGTKRRMKRHECAAADRHWRGRARHEVMIPSAMIRVLMADAADDGHLVHHLRQLRHAF